MPEVQQQVHIEYLIEQLAQKLRAYQVSLDEDRIFEIRRAILKDIRALEKEIALIQNKET